MKRRLIQVSAVILAVLTMAGALSVLSYRSAIRIEADVVKPSLSPSLRYERVIRFKACDPWTSLVPDWTIAHFEKPTVIDYESPSVSIDLFGRVVDWRSKEVGMGLVENGYR
jgi:hypothetical protein